MEDAATETVPPVVNTLPVVSTCWTGSVVSAKGMEDKASWDLVVKVLVVAEGRRALFDSVRWERGVDGANAVVAGTLSRMLVNDNVKEEIRLTMVVYLELLSGWK